MGLRRLALALALLLVGANCTHTTKRPEAARPTTSATTATTTGGALIRALPDGCAAAPPTVEQTVTFVKDGRAWAVDPNAGTLTCLFPVTDPGLFEWGPQADRIVLGGLAVRGVGSNAQRPSIDTKPTWFSWSRPRGMALVFTAGARTALKRADIGSASVADLSPLNGATYGDIAYHPSGLAIGFVAKQGNKTGIWMSGNHGENPKELVTSTDGTDFGPIVFSKSGSALSYGAHRGNDYFVAQLDLETGTVGNAWDGSGPITGLTEGQDIAVTFGPCAHRQAVVGGREREEKVPLLSGRAASVVGSLADGRFVLAGGACDGPRDVFVQALDGPAQLVVESVDRAAVRVAEPSPPPPLPKALPQSAFG